MKTKVFLASLFLCLAVTIQKGFCATFKAGDYTLVNQTKKAVLVVAGEVSDLQYMQPDLNSSYFYTDVTITVSKVFKGKPNIDKNTVRFRIEGGVGVEPLTGKISIMRDSFVPTFRIGQKLIIFLEKRTWGEEWPFHNGLYPLVFPPYPTISTIKENGKVYKVARFGLAFFEQHYLLKLPLDLAFRFIQNAVKAPGEMTFLEKEIREIKDIIKPENQGKQQVESPAFLSMLQSELTQIEEIIKEKERNNEQ